jgi:hypothetical protein
MRNRRSFLPACFRTRTRTAHRAPCQSATKVVQHTRTLLHAINDWHPRQLAPLRGVKWQLVLSAANALHTEFPTHNCTDRLQTFSCAQHAQHVELVRDATARLHVALRRRREPLPLADGAGSGAGGSATCPKQP